MSSMSFSIGGITFGSIGINDGVQAIEMDVGNARYVLKRFHSNGADGNFMVRCGRNGQPIKATWRYQGQLNAIYALYNSHKAAWENTAVEIVDPAGKAYERCQIEDIHKISNVMATGRAAGQCMFTVEATFTLDS